MQWMGSPVSACRSKTRGKKTSEIRFPIFSKDYFKGYGKFFSGMKSHYSDSRCMPCDLQAGFLFPFAVSRNVQAEEWLSISLFLDPGCQSHVIQLEFNTCHFMIRMKKGNGLTTKRTAELFCSMIFSAIFWEKTSGDESLKYLLPKYRPPISRFLCLQ